MIAKLCATALALQLFATAARADETPADSAEGGDASEVLGANQNHVFFHPFITLLSAAVPVVPTVVALTYERTLAAPGNSFIWQPQLIFGNSNPSGDEDIEVSQFGTAQYLGLRHYFGGGYRGFYLQGSGAAAVNSASAEKKGVTEKIHGTVIGYGALGYLGYRWTNVYFDVGGGFQAGNGTIKNDSGDEITVSGSGPAIDINLAFGF